MIPTCEMSDAELLAEAERFAAVFELLDQLGELLQAGTAEEVMARNLHGVLVAERRAVQAEMNRRVESLVSIEIDLDAEGLHP